MEIEDRTFSDEYSRHWMALMAAQQDFMRAMHRHIAEDPTPRHFRNAKRAFKMLSRAMQRCDAYIEKTTDDIEGQILAHFLTERAMPFMAFWQRLIDTAESGREVRFKASDIPPWTDDD